MAIVGIKGLKRTLHTDDVVRHHVQMCIDYWWIWRALVGCGWPVCMDYKVLCAKLWPTTCSVTSGNRSTWTKLFRRYCSTFKKLGVMIRAVNTCNGDG